MAKKTVQKARKEPFGRPTLYKPEYCEMLITHMAKGGSFESFAADANCHKETLYEWAHAHPAFSEAKKIGRAKSLKFYEEMGKMIATGQLRMVKKETPMLDKKGKPIFDDKGNVIYEREYMPAHASASAWIFLLKNMHKWHDNRNLFVSGNPDGNPIKIQPVARSPHDDLREIIEVQKVLKELDDARKPIDAIKITD